MKAILYFISLHQPQNTAAEGTEFSMQGQKGLKQKNGDNLEIFTGHQKTPATMDAIQNLHVRSQAFFV